MTVVKLVPCVGLVCLLAACQSGASVGTTCRRAADCAPGLECALGACRAACRESRDCGPDQRCLIEPSTGVSVCSVQTIDDCTTHGCPTDLVCAAGQCVNACGTVVTCPDGVCIANVCTRVVGDAGLPDAGQSDAGADAGLGCHGPQCDPVVRLAVGYERAFAVTQSGALWGWGDSATGTLGDGTTVHAGCSSCAARPVRAALSGGTPLPDVVDVAIGFDFGCALLGDHTVWCWGRNYDGQRGDGHPDDGSLAPSQVVRSDTLVLDRVVQVRATDVTACALRDASNPDAGVLTTTEVWCWGAGPHGELGTGAPVASSNVALHASELGAHTVTLTMAGTHVLALQADGSILGLGDDTCGALGGAAMTGASVLAVHGPRSDARELETSLYDTCALGPSGLSCWGGSGPVLGATGGTTTSCPSCALTTCTAMPAPIDLPAAFVHVFGPSHGTFLATTAEGALYSWGGSFDGPFPDQPTPTIVASLPPVVEAHVGGAAACALTTGGDVFCWGGNDHGQLGRGTLSAVGVSDPMPRPVLW